MTFTLDTIETAALNVVLGTYTPVYSVDVPPHLSEIQNKTGTTYVRVENIELKTALESNLNSRYRVKIIHPDVRGYETGSIRYERQNTIVFPGVNLPETDSELSSSLASYPFKVVPKNASNNIKTYINTTPTDLKHSYIYVDDPVKLDTVGQVDTGSHATKNIINGAIIKFNIVTVGITNFTAKFIANNPSTEPIFYSSIVTNIGKRIIINDETYIIVNKSQAPGGLNTAPETNFFTYPVGYKPQYKVKVIYDQSITVPLAYFNTTLNQDGFIADAVSEILVRGRRISMSSSSGVTLLNGNYNILVKLPGFNPVQTTAVENFMADEGVFSPGTDSQNYVASGFPPLSDTYKIKILVDYRNKTNVPFLITGSDFGGQDAEYPGQLPTNRTFTLYLRFLEERYNISNLGNIVNNIQVYDFNSRPYPGADTTSYFGTILGINYDSPAVKNQYNAYLMIPGGADPMTRPGVGSNYVVTKLDNVSAPRTLNIPSSVIPSVVTERGTFHKYGQQSYFTETEPGYLSVSRSEKVYGAFFTNSPETFDISFILSNAGPNFNTDQYSQYELFNIYDDTQTLIDQRMNDVNSSPIYREPVLIGAFKNKTAVSNISYRFILEYYNTNSWIKITDTDSASPTGEQTITVPIGNSDYAEVRIVTSEVLAHVESVAYAESPNMIGKTIVVGGSSYIIKDKEILSTDPNLARVLDEVNANLIEPDNGVVLVHPEQNMKNVVHHVMEQTNIITAKNFEKDYNMLITYSISETNPVLLYDSSITSLFDTPPTINFSEQNFTGETKNSTPLRTAIFDKTVEDYNIFNPGTDLTIHLVLVLPSQAPVGPSQVPVSTRTRKVAVVPSSTPTDFILYHRSSGSRVGGNPLIPTGTNFYGSNDPPVWLDNSSITFNNSAKPFMLSVADPGNREFGQAEFLLSVGTNFLILSDYKYVEFPEIEMINVGVYPSNFSKGTKTSGRAYHQRNTFAKTMAKITTLNSSIIGTEYAGSDFIRSIEDPDVSSTFNFQNFTLGNNVSIIIVSATSTAPATIYSVPRYLLSSTEFTTNNSVEGAVAINGQEITFYDDGKIKKAIPETNLDPAFDLVERDFTNVDLWYFVSGTDNNPSSHLATDGANFVDDVFQIAVPGLRLDLLQYLGSGPNSGNPNREGHIRAKTFSNTEITLYSVLDWAFVSIERVGIRDKNGQIVEINCSEKDPEGNYIYRNDTFQFGYNNEQSSLCTVSNMLSRVAMKIKTKSSLRGYVFEYIEISQEEPRTSGQIAYIQRER